MKKVTLKIISIIFVIVIITTGLVLLNSRIMKKEKVTIKTMTENEEVSNLQAQINQLNASHNEYARNVQAYKSKIATAITDMGVETSENATAEVMAENIGKILQAKTTATATAAQILTGKTAWVNGSKVTGTMANNGELNWNPTTSTTYTVPAGYYSGGTLSSENSYNKGLEEGKGNVEPLTLSGSFSTSGSARSGGWSRNISISTSGTILKATYSNYNTLTINSSSGCTITFTNHVLTITTSISGSNSQSNVADGTVSASTSGSYNITLT